MENNYFVSAFGTFGSPNGFKNSFFYINDNLHSIAKSIKTFDLNTNAIMVFPNSELFAIRKENIQNNCIISYCKYTFAKEPNSDRGGSFIGSSLIFVDKVATENITVSQLNNFHENLINNYVIDDTINVKNSSDFSINRPNDYEKIKNNLKVIEDLNTLQTNKILVVFCETSIDKLQEYFKKSIDLLNVYDTIYFTQSEEIAKYVKLKNIVPLIQNVGDLKEFELEIQKLNEDRLNKIEAFRNELVQEKEKLSKAKEVKKQEFVKNIETNKKTHQDNQSKIEEAENQLKKIGSDYNELSKKIDELIEKLNKGEKIEFIKQKLIQFSQDFKVLEINSRPTNSITSLPNVNRANSPQTNLENSYESKHHHKNQKVSNLGYYKLATIFLSITLIGVLAWFLYPLLTEEKPIENTNYTPEVIEQTDTDTLKLNPLPNSVSNIKVKTDAKIADIVKEIYKNDTIIKFYKHQKEDYSKHLFKLNEGKFLIQASDTILKDTIIAYPIYKKINEI